MIKLSEPMPHSDKHYQKLLRTYKFVVYMVLAALFVLGAGLSLMWLFDRVGGSFMSRGWQVFFIIVFALLVAALQIPGYIMDFRKIEMDNPSPAQPQKPKPYATISVMFTATRNAVTKPSPAEDVLDVGALWSFVTEGMASSTAVLTIQSATIY